MEDRYCSSLHTGTATAIHSIPVDQEVTLLALPVIVGVRLVLLARVWSGKISRVMGGLLVLAYAADLVGVVVLRLPGG